MLLLDTEPCCVPRLLPASFLQLRAGGDFVMGDWLDLALPLRRASVLASPAPQLV